METAFRFVLKQFLDNYFIGLDGKIDYSASTINVEDLHLRDELLQHFRQNNDTPFELQDAKISSLSVKTTEFGKLQVVASNVVLDFDLVPLKALGKAWIAGQEAQEAAAPGFVHEVQGLESNSNGGYWSALFGDKPKLPPPAEITANYCSTHVNPRTRRRANVRITECKMCSTKVQTNFKSLAVCMCCSLKSGRCLHCGSEDVPFRVPASVALPILEAERRRRYRSTPSAAVADRLLEAIELGLLEDEADAAAPAHAPSRRRPPSKRPPPSMAPLDVQPCGGKAGGEVLEDDEMDNGFPLAQPSDGFPSVQPSSSCLRDSVPIDMQPCGGKVGGAVSEPSPHPRPHPRPRPQPAQGHDCPLQPPQSQSGPLLGAGYLPPSPPDSATVHVASIGDEIPSHRKRSPLRAPRGIARSYSNLGWETEPDESAHVPESARASWPIAPPASDQWETSSFETSAQWETSSFETVLPLPVPSPGGLDLHAAVSPKPSRSPGRVAKKLSRSPSGRRRQGATEAPVKIGKGCKALTSGEDCMGFAEGAPRRPRIAQPKFERVTN